MYFEGKETCHWFEPLGEGGESAIESSKRLNASSIASGIGLVNSQSVEHLWPRRDANRPIDRVAPSEIDAGLLSVAKASYGIEQGDFICGTARQFGWRRTGQHIDRGLSEGIERLLKAGRLYLQANMLVASDNASRS